MNFEIITNTRFKVGVDIYNRIYQVVQKNNGLLKLVNVTTGKILYDNLDPENITINGSAMNSIEELQEVVYNRQCECDSELDDDNYRIFDMSFDETFE